MTFPAKGGAPVATVLKAAERDKLPDHAFAVPEKRVFPVHTAGHAAQSVADAKDTPDEARVNAAAFGKFPQLNPALRKARGTNAPFSSH